MSRRNHLKEVGCIAGGEDLSDFGSGKEGWLVNNPNLLVSLDNYTLALANRSSILLLHYPDNYLSVRIRPELSPIENEFVSALEWLVFDHDVRVLAIGTSAGYLFIYSLQGHLIHRQFINHGKILRLRVRGTKNDMMQEDTSEEVCVVMPGVIARIEGSHIKNLLRHWFQQEQSYSWEPDFNDSTPESSNSLSNLPYQLWNVSKYGLCADAAITGLMPPPLMEIQVLRKFMECTKSSGLAVFIVGQSSQRYYCAVCIGDDAVISAFRLSVDNNRSLVGAILSKVVPATFSTIASFSKLIWRSESTKTKKPEPKSQPFTRASPLTCLKDQPRKGEKLTLSPSGTLAAIADSLGRILLLDTQALVVVRLWKGYREASCLFVEMLADKDHADPHSTHREYSKSDYCLCLAIHAPRKGIIEVWQMRTGPRLLTIPCPKGSKILQPTYRFSSASSPSSSYVPLEIFFLNGDSGQISVLNRFLH